MSLVFSNTTTHRGIIQKIERTIYGQDAIGRISGNATLLAQWTAEINSALDKALAIIFKADGRWQFDDGNHDSPPTVTANLVANQRTYTFTEDVDSNLLLEVHAVYVKVGDVYVPLEPADELLESSFYDGQDLTGTPARYAKKGDGILLDPIPSTNVTDGIKIEISREGSYFTTDDTTKKPGFSGLYHDYLAIEPSFQYAAANNLANTDRLEREKLRLENGIMEAYSRRAKDERPIMSNKKILHI